MTPSVWAAPAAVVVTDRRADGGPARSDAAGAEHGVEDLHQPRRRFALFIAGLTRGYASGTMGRTLGEEVPMTVDNAALLDAARLGDQAAWNALVAEYNSLVWSIARGYRLESADAHDAVQMTWLRLVENLDRIKDPERLAGWLATTARRECLQLLRKSGRERPASED